MKKFLGLVFLASLSVADNVCAQEAARGYLRVGADAGVAIENVDQPSVLEGAITPVDTSNDVGPAVNAQASAGASFDLPQDRPVHVAGEVDLNLRAGAAAGEPSVQLDGGANLALRLGNRRGFEIGAGTDVSTNSYGTTGTVIQNSNNLTVGAFGPQVQANVSLGVGRLAYTQPNANEAHGEATVSSERAVSAGAEVNMDFGRFELDLRYLATVISHDGVTHLSADEITVAQDGSLEMRVRVLPRMGIYANANVRSLLSNSGEYINFDAFNTRSRVVEVGLGIQGQFDSRNREEIQEETRNRRVRAESASEDDSSVGFAEDEEYSDEAFYEAFGSN